MKEFCGIISEFNPFHNGHDYIIKKAKELTGLPVICLMSGNFVQRGEPAIVDKFTRAKCAIYSGADAVLELPTVYALSAAQGFAAGAIKILKELGCTSLAVGVTHTNIDDYYSLAKIKNQNIKQAILASNENGLSYSAALIGVLKLKHKNCDKIFSDASNILALEYISEIIAQKANIQVVLIERTDGGYNGSTIKNNFANATILRAMLNCGKEAAANKFLPQNAQLQLKDLPKLKAIEDIVYYNLRRCEAEDLAELYDYSEGLPYLISTNSRKTCSLDECIAASTTKRYRASRIKKLCLYPSLNITKANVSKIFKGRPIVRLLAIRKTQKAFISQCNSKHILIIVSNGDYKKLTPSQKLSANIDLSASNLYSIATGAVFNNDIKTGTLFL